MHENTLSMSTHLFTLYFFYMTHDEVLVSLLVCFCYVVKKEINKLKARE
jgi:hypothetical protein